MERMARDARMFTIGGGTAQVLRTFVAVAGAGLEAAADPRRLSAETLDARRRGVTMHPIFANAGEPAIPILFVNAATFEATIADIDDREQVYVRATGYEPKAGRHLVVPRRTAALAGVLFGLEAADER